MDQQEKVFEAVERIMPDLWEIATFLHQNPEVGYVEYGAQRRLVDFLQLHGFECKTGVAGFETALMGDSGKGRRPAVAFIAEYDALPELGHACGHNMIAASAVGAAVALVQAVPELMGQVSVIGTPAEEMPRPPAPVKQIMMEQGVFNNFDVALMMHPGDRTTTGWHTLAVDSFEFEFKGKPTHASKYPHLGRSALDAAVLTMNALEFLREHVRQDVRIHGVFVDGGTRANIVPESAKLHYMVRALDSGYLDEIQERVFNCARAGALATDTEVKISNLGRNDNKILSPALDKLLLENAAKAGAVNVMEPEEEMGSTDFGNVSHYLPASTLKAAFVPEGSPGHSREWAEAAGKPEAQKAVEFSSKALALTAYMVLTDAALLDQLKAPYQRGT